MDPIDVQAMFKKIGGAYQNVISENEHLKAVNLKLKEQIYRLKNTVPNKNESKSLKVLYMGSDFTVEGKCLLQFNYKSKIKYKSPINNVKMCQDEKWIAFSCSSRVFIYNLESKDVFLVSDNSIISYDPSTINNNIVEYDPKHFAFNKDKFVCCFSNKVSQFDLNTHELINEIKIKAPGHLDVSDDRIVVVSATEKKIITLDHKLKMLSKLNVSKGIKNIKYFKGNILYITEDKLGLANPKGVFTVDISMHSTLNVHKDTIYVSDDSILKMYIINHNGILEQTDSISFKHTILTTTIFLDSFIVIGCSKGIGYFYRTVNGKQMTIRTKENIIGCSSAKQNLLLLDASGGIKHFLCREIKRQTIKTLI